MRADDKVGEPPVRAWQLKRMLRRTAARALSIARLMNRRKGAVMVPQIGGVFDVRGPAVYVNGQSGYKGLRCTMRNLGMTRHAPAEF